jgi:dihydroflavonol-4-reductase
MRVLVTGSTGFVGGALCRALLAQGHQVRAFHRPGSALRLLEGLPVEHALGDLTQPETLLPAMQGIEVVFHAAAQLGGKGPLAQFLAVTAQGTRALLQAAQAAGVRRVVHTSSVAALGVPEVGPVKGVGLLDELHTWNYPPERWRYGYAKYQAELEVQRAVAMGMDVVIVNPSIVFGPGDIYRAQSSLVVVQARHPIPVSLPGGSNVVHLDDVVAGHLAALERGRTGERYILGGENLSHTALLRLAADVTGTRAARVVLPVWTAKLLAHLQPVLHLPIGADELGLAGYQFYYDTGKARRELGLAAPVPARRALQDAYDWFKRQPAG